MRGGGGDVLGVGAAADSIVKRVDMCSTCLYAESMSKMIQIRDVPDDVHRILKERAARGGMSLSDFLKRELAHAAERPTMEEWMARARPAKPIHVNSAKIIRDMRDSR